MYSHKDIKDMKSTFLQLTLIAIVALAAFLSIYLRRETAVPILKNPVELEQINQEPIPPR